jgi:hypothetical protein
MEVGNAGKQTLSDDKNMREELTSDRTANNDPDMQVTKDQILQINVQQDEIDMFCTETVENPHESPATEDNLRDRTNPLQPESAK